MQNIQTAQQAQNTQNVTVSISTAQKAADALYAYSRLADAAETIASTIKRLAQNDILIDAQAELLTQLIEDARLHHGDKGICYDL